MTPPHPLPRTRVVDLRAGHAAGKSFIAKHLISLYGQETLGLPGIYLCRSIDLVIVQTDTTGRNPPGLIPRRLEIALSHRRVLIEGTTSAHTKGRYLEAARIIGAGYVFVYLDTPVEECIRRAEARRRARNWKRSTQPFDPKNIIKEHQACKRVFDSIVEMGFYTRVANWQDPIPTVLDTLGVTV